MLIKIRIIDNTAIATTTTVTHRVPRNEHEFVSKVNSE